MPVHLQVANVEFFNETLPLFDAGDDVGMVLSPQSFYNVDLNADVFNHCNIQFWEYAQHGYDAISFNSCTGTAAPMAAHRGSITFEPVSPTICSLTGAMITFLWKDSVHLQEVPLDTASLIAFLNLLCRNQLPDKVSGF